METGLLACRIYIIIRIYIAIVDNTATSVMGLKKGILLYYNIKGI